MADLTLGRPVETFLSALAPPPLMPRKRRMKVSCAWSLERQGKSWSAEEDAVVRECWHRPDEVSRDEIAARLHRTTYSVVQRACHLGLGWRAPQQRPEGGGADDGGAIAPWVPHVEPLPRYDGVVMTARLEAAWHAVLAGVRLDVVLASARGLTAVEVAALRRWSEK